MNNNLFDDDDDFAVLSMADIRKRQEEDVSQISSVLSVSRASASLLLLHYKWSVTNVYDAWYDDQQKARTTVGLFDKPLIHCPDANQVITCPICFEGYPGGSMHAVACGHLFCRSCWKAYVTTAINGGPGCLTLRCPDSSCGAAVGLDAVDELIHEEGRRKYAGYMTRSYVETGRNVKWCPAPGCDYAVAGSKTTYDVSCNCGHRFCWNCTEEAHRPVDCDTAAKWILKSSYGNESTTWILANTKPCPQCRRPIQKICGNSCLPMTCASPCEFQFCWMCLGSWSDHGVKTGRVSDYSCARYEKARKKGAYKEEKKARKMAKHALDRYTNCYGGWAVNESSRKKAVAALKDFQKLEYRLNKAAFIAEAWMLMVECRRMLKWTYAYAYYLSESEHAKRELLEYLQDEAEARLERLHRCADKDLQVYVKTEEPATDFNNFREKLTTLTKVTRNYFQNLVRALENGLPEVNAKEQNNMGFLKDDAILLNQLTCLSV